MNKFKQTKFVFISNNWASVKLPEIVEIISGGTPKTTIADYWGGAIPWLSVVDFNNGLRHVYNTEKSITQKGLENSATNILKKGEIIISARGTVGAIAQLGKDMAFNQSCYGIRAKPQTSNDFIYYLLKYKVNALLANVHGAVFDTITRQTFDLVNVELPSLPEQRAIAKVLSCLDSKIELNREMNLTLEEIVQVLFKHWFVDFEFPNENGEPYKSSGGKMKQTQQGEIPESWKIGCLMDITNITSGKRPDVTSNTKCTQYNVPLIGASKIMGFVTKPLFEQPIIVIGRVGTHGKVQRFSEPSFPSDNTLVFQSNFYEYTYQILTQIDYSKLNVGAVQPLITQTMIGKYATLIPGNDVLTLFEKTVSIYFAKMLENRREIEKLQNIRDLLLPKLMSGKIRVPIEV